MVESFININRLAIVVCVLYVVVSYIAGFADGIAFGLAVGAVVAGGGPRGDVLATASFDFEVGE